jgi:colanic acid biosynthesis protein WcaH
LNREEFIRVVDATPLVAIDLVIRNGRGEVLLGKRGNRPAQHWWFVPGGRIRKDEPLQSALRRIAQTELQMEVPPGRLLGAFDHFYSDNFFGVDGISTHYVTLAYECAITGSHAIGHDDQHTEIKWWPVEALMQSTEVHENTKRYFSTSSDNGFRCASASE